MILDIEVLSSEWFATHRPVVFQLRIPTGRLYKTRLRFPRSLHELGLTNDETEVSANGMCQGEMPETLEQWGQLVEKVFDDAVAKISPHVANPA